MQRKAHLDALAVTLLVGCCLVWGGQQVLAKATLAEMPPIFQAALRLGGATGLLKSPTGCFFGGSLRFFSFCLSLNG